MDPLESGSGSTSMPSAASPSSPVSDGMLDHDDADAVTRATRSSTAAGGTGAPAEPHIIKSFDVTDPLVTAGKKRKLQTVQAEDGGEENGPRRTARVRESTATRQNEGTGGPSQSNGAFPAATCPSW